MNYTISDKNLHLIDSYKVSKKNFSSELNEIKREKPDYKVWNRGIPQMCLEISCHNFAYMVNYKRDRTADTDLEVPQKWYVRWFYAIVGVAVWAFIK